MSYKKRGQAGWTGKKEAKSKNYVERNFAKEEIKQALDEIEDGEEYKYKHYARKKLTTEQKLEKQIAWYERVYESWTRPNKEAQWKAHDNDGWFRRVVSGYKSKIEKLKKERDERLRSQEISKD